MLRLQPSEPARRYHRTHYLVNVEKALEYLRYRQVGIDFSTYFAYSKISRLFKFSYALQLLFWFTLDQTGEHTHQRHCRRQPYRHPWINMDHHSSFPSKLKKRYLVLSRHQYWLTFQQVRTIG